MEAGHSLKSALQHELDVDLRDEEEDGFRFRLTNEVAGGRLGGDLHHMKHSLNATWRQPVGDSGVRFGLSMRAGLLAPWRWWEQTRRQPASTAAPGGAATAVALQLQRPSRTHLADRFFLGGSLDVRGFGLHSLGPKIDRFAVGADAYWAAAAHLWSPLPGRLRAHLGEAVKLHLFANAGNGCRSASPEAQGLGQQLRQGWSQLIRQPAVSGGLGVTVQLNFCTVELNYVVPLLAPAHSVARGGFSASVGFEFL